MENLKRRIFPIKTHIFDKVLRSVIWSRLENTFITIEKYFSKTEKWRDMKKLDKPYRNFEKYYNLIVALATQLLSTYIAIKKMVLNIILQLGSLTLPHVTEYEPKSTTSLLIKIWNEMKRSKKNKKIQSCNDKR